jgi:hypothetical protein
MVRRPLPAARPSSTGMPVESPMARVVPAQRRRIAARQTAPGRRADADRPVMPGRPGAARSGAESRRARRRTVLMMAAVAATVSLGIGAPLAYAYGDSPGHHFGALTHYLEDDDR